MLYTEAKPIADKLKVLLEPYCERIEVAGSIRREKEIVKDIEIVLIPKNTNKLFNVLGLHLLRLNRDFQYIKNGDKYKQFYYQGIKVDLFVAHPDNWGYIFAIRTGSAEYSHNVLASGWVKKGFKGVDGFLTRNGEIIPVKEEIDLFNILEIEYREPSKRI
jgi:DNA polymerase/3'-5' exonuclease PolX